MHENQWDSLKNYENCSESHKSNKVLPLQWSTTKWHTCLQVHSVYTDSHWFSLILWIPIIFPLSQNHRHRSHSCPCRQQSLDHCDLNSQILGIFQFDTWFLSSNHLSFILTWVCVTLVLYVIQALFCICLSNTKWASGWRECSPTRKKAGVCAIMSIWLVHIKEHVWTVGTCPTTILLSAVTTCECVCEWQQWRRLYQEDLRAAWGMRPVCSPGSRSGRGWLPLILAWHSQKWLALAANVKRSWKLMAKLTGRYIKILQLQLQFTVTWTYLFTIVLKINICENSTFVKMCHDLLLFTHLWSYMAIGKISWQHTRGNYMISICLK